VSKVDGPDERFECCGERGRTPGAAALCFAFTEQEFIVEVHPLGDICESNPAHDGSTTLRQVSFACARISAVQRRAYNCTEERVSKEFKAFIIILRTRLMTP